MKKKISWLLTAAIVITTGYPNLVLAENYDIVSQEEFADGSDAENVGTDVAELAVETDESGSDAEGTNEVDSHFSEIELNDSASEDELELAVADEELTADEDFSDHEADTAGETVEGQSVSSVSEAAEVVGTAESSSLNPERLKELQGKYPDGLYWNGSFSEAVQCHGYALLISSEYYGFSFKYEYYGQGANSRVKRSTDSAYLSQLKAGDIVRYYNSAYKCYHSIWVTSVDGENVIYTDCNANGTNQIQWGAETTKSKLASQFDSTDESHIEIAPEAVEFDCSKENPVDGNTYTNEDICFEGWAVQGHVASPVSCMINGKNVECTIEYSASTEAYDNYSYLTEKNNHAGFKITVPKKNFKNGTNTYSVVGQDTNGNARVIMEGKFTYHETYQGDIRLLDITVEKNIRTALKNIQIYDNGSWKSYTTKNIGTSWTSSDPKIAYVNTFGAIVAVKAGTTMISGEIQNQEGVWIPVSCKVTVKNTNNEPKVTAIKEIYNSGDGIQLKWSKVTDAAGYMIYRKSGSGSYVLVKKITKNATVSYMDTSVKIKNGTGYTYVIYTYQDSVKSKASNTRSIVRVTAPALKTVKSSGAGKISITWNINNKASGYQLQYSTSSKFTAAAKLVTVNGKNALQKTLTGLSANKTYYVRLRAYAVQGGKKYYSAFCNAKSVKVAAQKSASKYSMSKVLSYYKKGQYDEAQKIADKLPQKASENAVKKMQKKVKKAYLTKLKTYNTDMFSQKAYMWDYYLTDIDKDGVPELLVTYGTCAADVKLYVYTYKNNKVKYAGKVSCPHYNFHACPDSNGMVVKSGSQGFEWAVKLSLEKGKLKSSLICQREIEGFNDLKGDYMKLPYVIDGHRNYFSKSPFNWADLK